MREAVIRFRFDNEKSTQIAYETMKELGYQPVMETGDQVFHIHVNGQDLTSALEVAEASGGTLVEEADMQESTLMDEAYCMNLIPIPAHLVNEDWAADEQDAGGDRGNNFDDLSARDEEAQGWNDEDTTNHFTGGVHL